MVNEIKRVSGLFRDRGDIGPERSPRFRSADGGEADDPRRRVGPAAVVDHASAHV